MSKSECVIFGRSPFIQDIDVQRLCQKYYTIGINWFTHDFQTDACFWNDHYDPNHYPTQVYLSAWIDTNIKRPSGAVEFIPQNAEKPLLHVLSRDGKLVLGFKLYTVSCAYNWALLNGFKKIYLVGIDHDENQNCFAHYEGATHGEMTEELAPESHQFLKKFICAKLEGVEVYQTNVLVSSQWDLPLSSVEVLL